MFDIWAFLLQTLTASGVALLLLTVKAMFRDKLPPKWQFAVWGILALTMLIPAGTGGRYVLFNWPLMVEALKSLLSAEFTFTRVLFPFPVLQSLPKTPGEWIFAGYVLGVILHLASYALSYIRLRRVLRFGRTADAELTALVQNIAGEQQVRLCRIVTVPGLPSAFVCGVFRPVLVLPEDSEIDDKVLLHELLHLKSRDTVWTILICLLRCIHWCNPLLVWCAGLAGNDLEARCDQRVLEQLEGEERRDYGRILLSMSNDRFARTPGATCVNNGGRNIRRRIEAIARFKKYPAGMELVSVCAVILLAIPLALGVEATEVIDLNSSVSPHVALASGRSVRCTTPAGAFDAYGKAVLHQNGVYRAMCTPEAMQEELAEAVTARHEQNLYPDWDSGIPCWPNAEAGYYIYNLSQLDENTYEGLFVVELNYPPDGKPGVEGMTYLAVQNLRVEKEKDRWVTIPLEDFRTVETEEQDLRRSCGDLPSIVYSGIACDIQADVKIQTVHRIDNSEYSYWATPDRSSDFGTVNWTQSVSCTHLGTEQEREAITQIGLSVAPLDEDEDRPELQPARGSRSSGSTGAGLSWGGGEFKADNGPTVPINDNGIGCPADMLSLEQPSYYAADLYLNGEKAAEMILTPQEGGTP